MKLTKYLQRKEGIILDILRHIRYFYFRYIINRKLSSLSLYDTEIKVIYNSNISFFGYYNISPINSNGAILFLTVDKENTRGSLVEPANIMIKKEDGSVKKIAYSKAWNWQQGCMLQWVPNYNNLIFFNDYDELKQQYISKIIDDSGKFIATYDIPVNNVSKSGEYALSLNYERLRQMRPDYGYFNIEKKRLLDDVKDGIWYLNLKNGRSKLTITLDQLKKLRPVDTMNIAVHKVNHLDINPSGTRFMFLHRWIGPKGRFMRLITANPDGTGLNILNGDLMTSHCCWIDDGSILSFCHVDGKGTGYFKFDDKSKNVVLYSDKLPKVDGHPSFSQDGQWLVMDTYPNKSRMSYIYLYSVINDRIQKLGRFYQPIRYKNEKRIDLHPKWTPRGKMIAFESGHSGKRKLYLLKVCKIKSF